MIQMIEGRSKVAKVVVLDVDGTLMDTNYLHVEAWARAFEEMGHRVPRVQIHKQIGKGSNLLIGEFVEDEETVEKIEELHSELYGELQKHGHPLPGAKELISSLLERGYEVWFVTSAKDEELEHHMSELEAEGGRELQARARHLRAYPPEGRRFGERDRGRRRRRLGYRGGGRGRHPHRGRPDRRGF